MTDAEHSIEEILQAETVDVEIDDYGFTGEGYVRLDDGWLSVPGALPGERVRVAVEDENDHPRRVFGQVSQILAPSEQRRDPLCGRDAECRGCQLRNLTIAEELRFKERTVREVIEKYADLAVEKQPDVEVITPRPIRRGDAFRIRSRLTYGISDGEPTVGLVSPVRDELVPMYDCPALSGSARRLVTHIETTLRGLHEPPPAHVRPGGEADAAEAGISHVSVATPTFGRGLVDVVIDGVEDPESFLEMLHDERIEGFLDALADRLPEDVGLSASGADEREYLKEPRRITLPLLDLKLVAGYEDWFPATIEPTEALYRHVGARLELTEDDRYLDVGCGIGTLSILAAPHVETATGIDINRHSIEAAELNAVQNNVHNVDFMASGWEKALRKLALDNRSFSAATINPMRSPLGERPLAYLDQLGVERLMYLGPSPESAAKDIGLLRSKGWRVDHLGAANIHPATYHTMLVARLHAESAPD